MITVHFKNSTRAAIDPQPYVEAIRRFLPKYGITDNVDVELSIVGSAHMRRLNREYRHKDYATDVLSFPVWPNLDTIKQQPGHVLLGTVVVCLPVAIRDAKKEGQDLEAKITFLVEHSLLHLMGFHHEGDE